jgi:hypothetical protein
MTYDQWKDPTYYDPPSTDEGMPDDDQLLDMAIAAARSTPNEIHDALLGLIGLVQSVAQRPDTPEDARKALLRGAAYSEARTVAKAYL